MYKIAFYVPESHVEIVKNALFAKGAGKIGHYEHCSWQTLGVGQFRPLDESKPFIGLKNQIHQEKEYLVEMVCPDFLVKLVLQELIQIHPYETPAYSVWKFMTLEDFNG